MSLLTVGAYQVERVSSVAGFDALKDQWSTLLRETPTASIFLTWEWMRTWWRHFGRDMDLWILTARNDAGELIGIAPWMVVHNEVGPMDLRQVTFIGSGLVYPAHLDIIASPRSRTAVAAAFLEYLGAYRREWDILDVEGVAENSALTSHLSSGDEHHNAEQRGICPFITLPDDWSSYEMTVLSSSFRSNLRRYRRRLERDYPGQVHVERVTTRGQLASAMTAFVLLQKKRWTAKGQTPPFSSRRFVAFHREVAATALEHDWLRLYQLVIGNRIIALNYCFHYGDVFYGYQKAFDPDWGRYSPGQVLQAHVIQDAIQEGTREFDMLNGDGGHKNAWTDDARADSRILLAGNWRGQLWLLGVELFNAALPIGKRTMPESVQRSVERFLFERRHA